MPHVIEAGTDAASLILFDPQTLPGEFDAANEASDPITILSRMHDEGRLFFINTGGDGGFLLHAFVNEPVTEYLEPYLRDPETGESFVVVGGAVVFAGAEYGYRSDSSFLAKYSHMGGIFPIENGKYKVTLYRTEYPDDLLDASFRQRVSSLQRLVHGAFESLAAFAAFSVLLLLVSLLFLNWRVWLTISLPATVAIVLLPIVLSKLSVYRQAADAWVTLQKEHPSMVAVFHTTGT